MNKVVWITVLNKDKDEAQAKKLYQAIAGYGLSPAGHFWQDRLEEMAWAGAREDLVKKETALWIVLGSAEALAAPTIRYGLSLLALGVQDQKGHGFPILIAVTAGEIKPETLPSPLRAADVLSAAQANLGVKIAAKANMPVKKVPADYRLDVYGLPGIGQWFEVGPAQGHAWNGVMFGVNAGDIDAHGVGPAHKLPERSVLEYPMKGMKIDLGGVEYTAWAAQNELKSDSSYYLRVKGFPSAVLFGPLAQTEEAEAYVIKLK
ncbi:MAG: hypothetical protein AB1641_01050 [Thermodesulfobacteriota bacterium]